MKLVKMRVWYNVVNSSEDFNDIDSYVAMMRQANLRTCQLLLVIRIFYNLGNITFCYISYSSF